MAHENETKQGQINNGVEDKNAQDTPNISAENSTSVPDKKDVTSLFDFSEAIKSINFSKILFKGYAETGPIEVIQGLTVELRTLLNEELLICNEAASKYSDPESYKRAYIIEYLVYSIIKFRNGSLDMSMDEKKTFRSEYGHDPNSEEQARWVLLKKIPPFVIEFIYSLAFRFKQEFDLYFIRKIEEKIKDAVKATKEQYPDADNGNPGDSAKS